jgi:hypothetical protein
MDTIPKDPLTTVYLRHESGRMDSLTGRRLAKLRKEVLAGRGGVEVTNLVISGYVGFLARTGEVHEFEDLANEFGA